MEIRMPNNGEHRCTQTQCSYYTGDTGNCKACQKCGADSFIINESCETCFKCENIPNELRFDDPKAKEQSQKQQEVINAVNNLAKALENLKSSEKEKEPKVPPKIKVIQNQGD